MSFLETLFELSNLMFHLLEVLFTAQDEGPSEDAMLFLESGYLCLHPLSHPLHFLQLSGLLRLRHNASLNIFDKAIALKGNLKQPQNHLLGLVHFCAPC